MQKPLLTMQDSKGVEESIHPETEVSQIVDIATYVDNKDKTILSSAKSYADTKKSEAISTASSDATTKANNAKSAAITDAKQYIKSVSTDGGIITLTKGDGSTSSFTPVLDNAAAHNGIYRGKDITSAWNAGTVSTNIQNGTFHDIYIGDYITKTITVDGTAITTKWIVADLDYHYLYGDYTTTAHHAVMVPEDVLNINTRMNASNDTTGGYIATEMWKTTIPKYATAIQSAFGSDHVLSHRELLSNAISSTAASMAGAGWTGSTTNWAWCDVTVNIMNEPMVYGGAVLSSSFYDVGECNKQLALFALNKSSAIAGYRQNRTDRKWYWLRSVVFSSGFAGADGYGDARYADASVSDAWSGFRPYFLLH